MRPARCPASLAVAQLLRSVVVQLWALNQRLLQLRLMHTPTLRGLFSRRADQCLLPLLI